MHTYKKDDDKWLVGHYVPVQWFNPLFGPRTVDEWETIKECETEDEAQNLVCKLNGRGQ